MLEFDTVEKLGRSTIQHGPLNNRIYLLKLDGADMPGLLLRMDQLARVRGYTKILAKLPEEMFPRFEESGYIREAVIPGLIRGKVSGGFLGKFLDSDRRRMPQTGWFRKVLKLIRDDAGCGLRSKKDLPIACCTPADAAEISRVYQRVFQSYPFPITDPEYVKKIMATHVRFYCVRSADRIVALASSELDEENLNVEMTDFATLPDHRTRGLAGYLLTKMESDMAALGMRTAYTIARSVSPGMNLVFSRGGYTLAGTLINNTQIAGGIESMHVWYKGLME